MSNELKPGDRAVIIAGPPCCRNSGEVGKIITVESVGEFSATCFFCGTRYPLRTYLLFESRCVISKDRVVRLPPDSECKQLFRETSKPREAA